MRHCSIKQNTIALYVISTQWLLLYKHHSLPYTSRRSEFYLHILDRLQLNDVITQTLVPFLIVRTIDPCCSYCVSQCLPPRGVLSGSKTRHIVLK